MLRSTIQGHPSWCLLWVLRDGGIIAVSVKGYCKPPAFMRGFMTDCSSCWSHLGTLGLLERLSRCLFLPVPLVHGKADARAVQSSQECPGRAAIERQQPQSVARSRERP